MYMETVSKYGNLSVSCCFEVVNLGW